MSPGSASAVLKRLGISAPILQAPMAGAGGLELAVAALKGGALASLPCGMAAIEQIEREVAEFRRRARGAINLNFFCHQLDEQVDDRHWRALLQPYYDELGVEDGSPPPLRRPFASEHADMVERLRPDVVSFIFGLPAPALLDRVRATGAFVIANATTVAEARWLEARGVDAVIAQGFEAGGHSGRFLGSDPAAALGLFALLPQIVDAVSIPVIATGGIADARGIVAALALGAAAVQIGTAYLRTPESSIAAPYRRALASDGAGHTVLTNLFSGGLARGIPNRLMDDLGAVNPVAPPYPHASAALAPLRRAAESAGRGDFSPMWAGQAAPLAREEGATDLTQRLAQEAQALLSQMAERTRTS